MSRSIFCIQRVGDENQPFSVLKKIQQIPPISVWGSRIFSTLDHPTFQGWMILFLFVIVCAWKFPSNLSQSPHPKTLAPQCQLAQQLQPSKGVQSSCSEVTPWHMIWNSTMAASCDKIHVLHFKRWKNQQFSAQKGPKMSKMSKTFAPPPSCCWSPLRADTKQRGGEVLVTRQMMKIYGTMGIYGFFPISIDMATRYIYIMIYRSPIEF